jgi:exosortase
VTAGVLGSAFVALFFRWFHAQHQISSSQLADWGHSYVVPLISGYLIWQRRDELAAVRPTTYWPGFAPFLLGVISYFFFVTTRFAGGFMIQGWAMILTLAGLVLLLTGPRAFRIVFLPILYLVVGVAISQQPMSKLTAPLQLVASQGAFVVLSIAGAIGGFTVDVNGTVLRIINHAGRELPLNVAEACAGMRMVIAFFALAGATALLGCRYWWQRIAIMLLAAPVAILINVGRVAVLGMLSLADQNLATGEAHTLIGEFLLVPGLLLFLLVVWALNRIVSEPDARPA